MFYEDDSHGCLFAPSLLILMIALACLAIPAYATSSSIQNVKTLPLSTHGYSFEGVQDSNSTGEALGLGWLSEDVPADVRVTPVHAAALPTHFEWRSNGGSNWMTPVKNQGGCGSCVAFGAVGATEAQFKIQAGNPGWSLDLSEQHLFSCGGGSCSGGWYISAALNYLKNYGIPDESCSPYQAQSGGASCSNSCPDWQSRAFKIASWSWVANNPGALQAALMNGPLVAGFNVYRDFFGYSGGVYHYDGQSSLAGGHAIVIVGYDSNEQYWIVKNSWGSYWGEGGYFRIGFGEAGIENYVASVTVSLATATETTTVALTQTASSYLYRTTTKTVVSYASTFTSTSTIPTATTVVLAPLRLTSSARGTQLLTSFLTTRVTKYTSTTTSTSTSVVYTTVTASPERGAGASSPLAYLGFTSLLAFTVVHRVSATKAGRTRKTRSLMRRRCSTG